MKYMMWALVALFLIACTQQSTETAEQQVAAASLLSLEEYQQENSYAFECNTTGFEPHTYEWDFGDGTTRTTRYKGVAHTYFTSGTYTISCTASDDLISETSTMTVDVAIPDYDTFDPEIMGDDDLIDLLSDPFEDTTTEYLIADTPESMPTTRPVREEDEYDNIFDFEFEDFDEETEDPATNTTNASNHTNTTNTTNNTTNNTNHNETEWPDVNITDINITDDIPFNETEERNNTAEDDEKQDEKEDDEKEDDKETKKDKERDDRKEDDEIEDETEDDEEKDEEAEQRSEQNDPGEEVEIKFTKQLNLKQLKVRLR